MKDFMEQLNDLAAPITRAYSEPEIVDLRIVPGNIGQDKAEFSLIIRCKRTPLNAWHAVTEKTGE